MKNLLTKALFISLLLSAAIPFSIQANLFASFKNKYNSNKWVYYGTNATILLSIPIVWKLNPAVRKPAEKAATIIAAKLTVTELRKGFKKNITLERMKELKAAGKEI